MPTDSVWVLMIFSLMFPSEAAYVGFYVQHKQCDTAKAAVMVDQMNEVVAYECRRFNVIDTYSLLRSSK